MILNVVVESKASKCQFPMQTIATSHRHHDQPKLQPFQMLQYCRKRGQKTRPKSQFMYVFLKTKASDWQVLPQSIPECHWHHDELDLHAFNMLQHLVPACIKKRPKCQLFYVFVESNASNRLILLFAIAA